MNDLDFKVLREKDLLLIPDQTEGVMANQSQILALKVELARNFGILLKYSVGITEEFVLDFFMWLKERGKLITQPYFPSLLPLDQDGVNIEDLTNKPKRTVITIPRSCFAKRIMENRRPDSLELSWLEKEMETSEGPTKLLSGFLVKHLVGKKIKAGRKDRRQFMSSLEGVESLYNYSLNMTDLWKKVALWIHPSDYPDYPRAQRFLFHILNPEKKREPEKPKLKKLMWKGLKEGKEFDVFESYIDQPELTPVDLLVSLQDYERCPRISRWKKTEGVELGRENAREEEAEIVDLMLLQIKEKLLGMLKLKRANLKIPDSFYKISAQSILKFPLVIAGGVMPEEVEGFRITASKNVNLITYALDGSNSVDKEWHKIRECLDFFIVGYQTEGWKRSKLLISFLNDNGETIRKWKSEIEINEEVRSLILFGYESSSRTLKWIGEPSKTFYAGNPSGIGNWKKVWEIVMERKPILSLGELAEKMYDNSGDPTEELTAERIRIDLGL